MISTGARNAEDAPDARSLTRPGIFTAIAMAVALVALAWAAFFAAAGHGVLAFAGAACVTMAALAGGVFLRRVILDLADREKHAARMAGHDLLSGLANRQLFAQWLEYELARHRREGVHFALMYLDVDHFKEINDRHGHDAGDRMVVAVARRISETLRPTDRFARLGGDEFAILQTGVRTMSDAEALANRIVGCMRLSFSLGDLEVLSSVSIGIALCPENATEREDLMKLADLALYRAKKEGRNRFAFFDARMGEELARRRAFSNELAEAIEADALSIDYLPVQEAQTRRLVSAEARLRWLHPERGPVPAEDLVNVAQARGFLVRLGDWVLRRACRDALDWEGLRVSVEISPVQFRGRDFAPHVVGILRETGLDPARLDLVLSEDCVLHSTEHAIAGMTALRNEGVHFTLGRFGAGVASLNYLRRFPFSRIKLDRAFAGSPPGMTAGAAALHAAIHLGRELGMTITADGVESEEQARYLTALGCQELQGRAIAPFASGAELSPTAVPAQIGRLSA